RAPLQRQVDRHHRRGDQAPQCEPEPRPRRGQAASGWWWRRWWGSATRGVATGAELIAESATGARRFRIPLVDRVVDVEPGVRAVGRKLVGANEAYFDGHFPGTPVFPGVLLCEALAQLGAIAVGEGDDVALRGVQRARFRRPILPGDAL